MHKKELLTPQPASRHVALSRAAQDPSARTVPGSAGVPIIIIEPNPLLRQGIGRLLAESHYEVVTSTATIDDVVAPPRRAPELVLIGGSETGPIVRTIENCRDLYPHARRVVFNDAQGEQLKAILDAGAHACLGRDITIEALLMTLDLAMIGANIVCRPPPHIASKPSGLVRHTQKVSEIPLPPTPPETSHRLSAREIAIVECLMHGDSNKVIARKFQIAEATVKVHVKAILRKIRAANRTQAAIWAMTHLPFEDRNSSDRATAV